MWGSLRSPPGFCQNLVASLVVHAAGAAGDACGQHCLLDSHGTTNSSGSWAPQRGGWAPQRQQTPSLWRRCGIELNYTCGGSSAPGAADRLEDAIRALTVATTQLGTTAKVAAKMLGFHTWRMFRYSSTNVTKVRDENFKRDVVKAYGAKRRHQFRDNLLNVYLPSKIVIAARLFKREWREFSEIVLGFPNIDDLKNALLLNKFCEAAFDHGYLVLMWQLDMKSRYDIDAGAGHPPAQEPLKVESSDVAGLSYGSSHACTAQPAVLATSTGLNVGAPVFVPSSSASCSFSPKSHSAASSSSSSSMQASTLPPRSHSVPSLTGSSSGGHTRAALPAPAAHAHSESLCKVTNLFDKGQVVAYYLGDLDMVAADSSKWPWGSAEVDAEMKDLLTSAFQGQTVEELVEGKPLTFMTRHKHRPYLRCLLFQAEAVLHNATTTGRLRGDRADILNELLQRFRDHVRGVSPTGSIAMTRFFEAC